MSGSIGIPPGTALLQDNKRSMRRMTHQQALDRSGHGALVQAIAAEQPARGSWQFRIVPDPAYNEEGDPLWALQGSSPETDEWNNVFTGPIDAVVESIRRLRAFE
jgi:hypothetical protein